MVMNQPPFETSMERGRFTQVLSLVKNNSFSVDSYASFLSPDIAWYNGHYYPPFPPGVALISAPFYYIFQYVNLGQIAATIPTTLASLMVAYLLLRISLEWGMSRKSAFLTALIYGIASVAFAYTVSLSAHPFSALITTMLVWWILELTKNTNSLRALFFLWLSFGLNFFIDYPNLAITLPLVLYGTGIATLSNLRDGTSTTFGKKLFICIMACGLWAIPFVSYNMIHYQTPIAFTNSYNLKRLEIQGIDTKNTPLSNDLFTQKSYAGRFDLTRIWTGATILLVSHDRGLFTYSPVLLFSLTGIWLLIKRFPALSIAMLAAILLDVVVYGSFDDPWGGWAFGPRYLIVTIPLWALFAGFAYDFLIKRYVWVRYIFLGLLFVSIGINLAGALTTNAVPPSIEVMGRMKDNVFYSLDYLRGGNASAFVFEEFLNTYISAMEFGLLIYFICVTAILLILQKFVGEQKRR